MHVFVTKVIKSQMIPVRNEAYNNLLAVGCVHFSYFNNMYFSLHQKHWVTKANLIYIFTMLFIIFLRVGGVTGHKTAKLDSRRICPNLEYFQNPFGMPVIYH